MKRALASMPVLHADRINAMRTLIRIYCSQSRIADNEENIEKKHNACMDMYQRIQQLIEYHLGNHHPLTAELYSLQADYHFSVSKNEQG